MKASVKVYLNPMSESMVQLSVKNFHFVKPGLIKHVSLVWMELKLDSTQHTHTKFFKRGI